MSDPHATGEATVTVKYGKGYDASWAVFRGSLGRIREDIVSYFGMDPSKVEGLTLNALVIEATAIAQGVSSALQGLGGTILPTESASVREAPSSASEQGSAEDVWAQAKQQASEPAVNPLYKQVEEATSVDGLKSLYAENQSAFKDDADLFEAWKAKGRKLQGEAA